MLRTILLHHTNAHNVALCTITKILSVIRRIFQSVFYMILLYKEKLESYHKSYHKNVFDSSIYFTPKIHI